MIDLALHAFMGCAFTLVLLWGGLVSWIAVGAVTVFGYGREQRDVAWKRREKTHGPHEWKPWQWSAHTHREGWSWTVGALCALAIYSRF